jgi:hypothetical protein
MRLVYKTLSSLNTTVIKDLIKEKLKIVLKDEHHG